MPNSARRKEKQRLKREKKKAELRRANSISPYKRIGEIGPLEACYVNSDWRTSRLASIQVIRRNPAGAMAMVGFLIDLWCAGLKDAWGRIDLGREDIDRNLGLVRQQYELERIDIETVRTLVAGAIRFSGQNGFRLPPHHDRWTSMIGGIPDARSADLHRFGKDGGLFWVGPMDDLRRRLIGCTLEEFIARPDVHFVTEADAEFAPLTGESEDDDEVDEEFSRQVEELRMEFDRNLQELTEAVRAACALIGEAPDPKLDQALAASLALTAWNGSIDAAEEGDDGAELICAAAEDLLLERAPEVFVNGEVVREVPSSLRQACDQVERVLAHGEQSAGNPRQIVRPPI